MAAAFHYFTVIHNNNPVCVLNGGKTVGNDNTGAVLHDKMHGILDCFLCAGIHIGSSLIQNQYFRVCGKCAGNGEELALSLDDIFTGSGQHRIIPLRKHLNHITAPAHFCRPLQLYFIRIFISVL